MIISNWPFLIISFLFFYLIYKVGKNSQELHDLRHDLNDLEVEVGVLKNEDWAIKSVRNKEKIMREYQGYYDGETLDGKHDIDQAKYRRQKDNKDLELDKKITLEDSQLNEIIDDYGGNWHEWLKDKKIK